MPSLVGMPMGMGFTFWSRPVAVVLGYCEYRLTASDETSASVPLS